jgi:hypothetical protein
MQAYTVWIEAEHWVPGSWTTTDTNTDVTVTLADGTVWFATFLTYANITSLTEKNKRTGENLAGRYFWTLDMILVDEVSRERIEEVVAHLLTEGKFQSVFRKG